MISVLVSCGIWLQIATSQGLPVASSHCIIGAIAGMSWIQGGVKAVDWSSLGLISLTWIVTPLISGLIAIIFYTLIRQGILEPKDSLAQLKEWIPWLSFLVFSIFGVIVFPIFLDNPMLETISIPHHTLSLLLGGIAIFYVTIHSWKLLESSSKQLEDKFVQKAIEKVLGRFQVISACFVAFAHGSNDVGNAIAPLAAIFYVIQTNTIPNQSLSIPTWIFMLGGAGIAAGLALQGKNVIATVGEKIITLQPSRGFSAEIATATTILLASRLGLPISTSHALIGSVVGIGMIQNQDKLNFETVKSVVLAWLVTLPITIFIGAMTFTILRLFVING